jgi:hypothetical protein
VVNGEENSQQQQTRKINGGVREMDMKNKILSFTIK